MPAPAAKPPVLRGDILRAIRLAHGQRLREVSAATGVDCSVLSRVERGHPPGRPRQKTWPYVYPVAAHFDLPPKFFEGSRPTLPILMRLCGVSRSDLAAYLDVPAGTVAAWESGKEPLTVAVARAIMLRLGLPDPLHTALLTDSAQVAA
jgi:transcriptional regulator with XRE-family HTH domain